MLSFSALYSALMYMQQLLLLCACYYTCSFPSPLPLLLPLSLSLSLSLQIIRIPVSIFSLTFHCTHTHAHSSSFSLSLSLPLFSYIYKLKKQHYCKHWNSAVIAANKMMIVDSLVSTIGLPPPLIKMVAPNFDRDFELSNCSLNELLFLPDCSEDLILSWRFHWYP